MAGHEFLRGPIPRVRSLPAQREGFTESQKQKRTTKGKLIYENSK